MRTALALWAIGAVSLASDWSTMPPEGSDVPALRDPLPFGHEAHGVSFERAGLTCVICHPIGLAAVKDGEQEPLIETLPPPLTTCHGCHRGAVTGAPRSAPGTCTMCHSNAGELAPASHQVDWLRHHAAEARTNGPTCRYCHERTECVSCHERRGPHAISPHPPAYATIHGIEAALDPASCSRCHAAITCTSCHATGRLPL